MANMLRNLKTMAIFVLIGPLIGMAVAINWLLPGGETSLRMLFDIAILAYMFGSPFAVLTGAAAAFLKRFRPIVYLCSVPILAAGLGMFGGWLGAVCCLIAALVCALLDQWWNPPARAPDASAAGTARPAP